MTSLAKWFSLVVAAVIMELLLSAQGAAGGPASARVDPTKPPVAPSRGTAVSENNGTVGEGSLQVQSILVGERRRVALIDGRAYRVGDSVGGLSVQNIFRDRVVLKGEGGTRILRLIMSSGMEKAPSP